MAISPTFITAFGLIERLVPAAKLTEGITWVMTGIGIGMAIGSFASGWVIDEFGASSGFWVSVAAGGVALAYRAARPVQPGNAIAQRQFAGRRWLERVRTPVAPRFRESPSWRS